MTENKQNIITLDIEGAKKILREYRNDPPIAGPNDKILAAASDLANPFCRTCHGIGHTRERHWDEFREWESIIICKCVDDRL